MNRLKNYTLLYVEDDLSVQKNLSQYLSAFFKEVIVANDGKEALAKYKSGLIDVALLDIDLPQIDGLTLAKEIRSLNLNIPIVMLTAFTDKKMLLKAVELRLLKYLVKPIDILELKGCLNLIADELERVNSNMVIFDSNCRWDKETQSLFDGAKEIKLSTKEQKLLKLLIDNRNRSVSFETIMAEVWEDSFEIDISFGSVKNLVSSLRKKLPKDCINSVYGVGYIFSK